MTGRHFKPRDRVQTTFMPMRWGGGDILFRKAQKVAVTDVMNLWLVIANVICTQPLDI